MLDFTAHLAETQKNFASSGAAAVDPNQALLQHARDQDSLARQNITQGLFQCPGDYNRIPYGWRMSPFMGKCGFKIQMKDFYSPDSPCYPIQDLSCMGPVQKKAWANVCKTEFPCKPYTPPPFPKPYRAPPSFFRTPTRSGPSSFDVIINAVLENIWAALGVSLASCIGVSLLVSSNDAKKRDEDVGMNPEKLD